MQTVSDRTLTAANSIHADEAVVHRRRQRAQYQPRLNQRPVNQQCRLKAFQSAKPARRVRHFSGGETR